MKNIFHTSFYGHFYDNNETSIERAINKICGLIQCVEVIDGNGNQRFNLDFTKTNNTDVEHTNEINTSEWLSIYIGEPTSGQDIIYEGNFGGIRGTYSHYDKKDKVGIVLTDSGYRDIFENWKPNIKI